MYDKIIVVHKAAATVAQEKDVTVKRNDELSQ